MTEYLTPEQQSVVDTCWKRLLTYFAHDALLPDCNRNGYLIYLNQQPLRVSLDILNMSAWREVYKKTKFNFSQDLALPLTELVKQHTALAVQRWATQLGTLPSRKDELVVRVANDKDAEGGIGPDCTESIEVTCRITKRQLLSGKWEVEGGSWRFELAIVDGDVLEHLGIEESFK